MTNRWRFPIWVVGALLLVLSAASPASAQALDGAAASPSYDLSAYGSDPQAYYPAGYAQDRVGGILKASIPGLVGAAAGGFLGYRFGGVMGAVVGGLGGFLAGQLAGKAFGLGDDDDQRTYGSSTSYGNGTYDPYATQDPYTTYDSSVSYDPPATYDYGTASAVNATIPASSLTNTTLPGSDYFFSPMEATTDAPMAPGTTAAPSTNGRRERFLKRFDTNGDGQVDATERAAVATEWLKRLDTDGDGAVSDTERQAFRAAHGAMGHRGGLRMSDPSLAEAKARFQAAFTAYQNALKAGGTGEAERATFEAERQAFHAKMRDLRGTAAPAAP